MKHNCRPTLQFPAATLLFALLLSGCACPPTADQHSKKAAIERRLQEVLTAAETKDFARLDSYHLYGPRFTKFTGSSPERLDATAAREGEHKGLGGVQGMKMRWDNLKIDVFGKTAIATSILAYSSDSADKTFRERCTLIFVHDADSWKIVHEHLSRIAD